MKLSPASLALAAALATASVWASPVGATPVHGGRPAHQTAKRAAAARLEARATAAAIRLRPAEQLAAARAARIAHLAARHRAAKQDVAVLARQVAAGPSASSRPATRQQMGPVSRRVPAAASRGAPDGATAARLARLHQSVRRADALASALARARSSAAPLRRRELIRAGAIEQTVKAARRPVDRAEEAARDAAGRVATRASRQTSLQDAIATLRTMPQAPGGRQDGKDGLLPGAPVAGPLVQRYGQATDSGPASGVSYAPPPAALVSSPCRGRVDFAGPFRSYGKMVIVDCGRGWRFVLAGLDRVDAAPGTAVGAGAPLGRMPDYDPGMSGRPTLYVQLRRGSETVDPARYARR